MLGGEIGFLRSAAGGAVMLGGELGSLIVVLVCLVFSAFFSSSEAFFLARASCREVFGPAVSGR